MTKRRGRPEQSEKEEEQTSTAFQWIPLWGWVLIFLLPLITSEFMFWNAGRVPSMIIFPIAWVGFWYTIMQRSGWPILKNRKKNRKSKEESVSGEEG